MPLCCSTLKDFFIFSKFDHFRRFWLDPKITKLSLNQSLKLILGFPLVVLMVLSHVDSLFLLDTISCLFKSCIYDFAFARLNIVYTILGRTWPMFNAFWLNCVFI